MFFRKIFNLYPTVLLNGSRTIFQKTPEVLPVIPLVEVWRFIKECMEAAGASEENANIMADVITEADYRGHHFYGLKSLGGHIKNITSGFCNAASKPEILQETSATAWVEGCNILGGVVGCFCMDLAVEKAQNCGIGFVSVKHSNNYGVAATYVNRAVKRGLLGFTCCNAYPMMMPTRSGEAFLGTNPIAFGAPCCEKESFILDMATTAISVEKLHNFNDCEMKIPTGVAIDRTARYINNPREALDGKRLLPLGGKEELGGYKGYGLAVMVEILSSILSGSPYGPNVSDPNDEENPEDISQCFFAIDPNHFAPDFQARLHEMITALRDLPSTKPNDYVLVAGDLDRDHMCDVKDLGGMTYSRQEIGTLRRLAETLNVKMLRQTCKK